MLKLIFELLVLALAIYGAYCLYRKFFGKVLDWEKEINSYIMNAGVEVKTTGEHLRNFVNKIKTKL